MEAPEAFAFLTSNVSPIWAAPGIASGQSTGRAALRVHCLPKPPNPSTLCTPLAPHWTLTLPAFAQFDGFNGGRAQGMVVQGS